MLGKPSNEPNPRNANHLLVGYIPVRAVRRARGRRALREDADLERLYAVADAGRAGAGPVAGPAEPAVVLDWLH